MLLCGSTSRELTSGRRLDSRESECSVTTRVVKMRVHDRVCARLGVLNMTYNYLSGDVPTGLLAQFNSSSFDYNCLNNCTYLRQATCANVSQSEYQALVDLYNATSGASWRTQTGWMSGTDPCYLNATSTWWGVGCVYGRGQCGRAIRCDSAEVHK